MYMAQININVTPSFARKLKTLMKLRRIRTKSEAIRVAVDEALERAKQPPPVTDFSEWLGIGNRGPDRPDRKFLSDDDLWEKGPLT